MKYDIKFLKNIQIYIKFSHFLSKRFIILVKYNCIQYKIIKMITSLEFRSKLHLNRSIIG